MSTIKNGVEMEHKSSKNIYSFYFIFISFIVGSLLGIFLQILNSKYQIDFSFIVNRVINPFGIVFVKMLKMIVIPIVFFSLFQGASNLELKKFGRIGIKIILWYLGTSFFAAIIGTIVAFIVNPGSYSLVDINKINLLSGVKVNATKISFSEIILNIFENPFSALSNGNFLGIIFFAIISGISYRLLLDSERINNDIISQLINQINLILYKIVDFILLYAPFGVFCLSIVNFYNFGIGLIRPYFKIAIGVIFSILLMIFVVYSGIVFLFTKTSPFTFLKKIKNVLLTAFVTRSSAATLPVSLRTAIENLRVRKEVAEFSLPLGATINMDGVCVHLPMFVILAANLFSIHLTLGSIIILIITTVLAAIGAGGVPGGSLILLFIVLGSLGINESQQALIISFAMGINPILDMFETTNNVTGDIMCTYVVSKNEGLVNEEK